MKILIALLMMSSMIMAENEKMKTDSTPVEDSSTVDIGYTDDIEQTYDKVKCKVSKELLQINETFQENRFAKLWKVFTYANYLNAFLYKLLYFAKAAVKEIKYKNNW